jgi:hypothetical protein
MRRVHSLYRKLVTDMLMDTIAEKYPELLPDNIPFTFSP